MVAEIEDLVGDGGAVFRTLADKTAAIRSNLPREAVVRGLLVIRATARNRDTVHAYPDVFASRFPGSSVAWLVP